MNAVKISATPNTYMKILCTNAFEYKEIALFLSSFFFTNTYSANSSSFKILTYLKFLYNKYASTNTARIYGSGWNSKKIEFS